MRGAVQILLVGSALLGCIETEWLFSNIPESDSSKAMVVGVELDDRVTIAAVDLTEADDALFLRIVDVEDPRAEIEALLYADSLEYHDLPSGLLAEDKNPNARALPPPDRGIFRTRVRDGVVAEWESRDLMSDRIASFRIPAPDCPTIKVHEVPNPHVSGVWYIRFLLPVEEDLALAGMMGGDVYLVSPTEVKPVEVLGVHRFSAGTVGPDGKFWLVGSRRLLRAQLTPDKSRLELTTEVEDSNLSFSQGWVTVSSTTSVEVFFMSATGHFMRYAEGNLELLETVPDTDGTTFGAVMQLGPGRAIACHGDKGRLLHYEDGAVRYDSLGVSDICTAGVNIPGLGVLIGTEFGGVWEYEKEGPGWNKIINLQIRYTSRHMVPYRDHLAVLGQQNWLMFYHPKRAVCVASEQSFGHDNRFLAAFTNRLVAAAPHGEVFYWYEPIYP